MKIKRFIGIALFTLTGVANAVTGDVIGNWNQKSIKSVWFQTWTGHYLVEIVTTDGGDYSFPFDPNSSIQIQLANNYHAAALSAIATGSQVKLFLINSTTLGGISSGSW